MLRAVHQSNGFSLVEVAMALGLLSFSLVPILAMLPLGLSNSDDASQQSSAVQALNAVSNSIQSASVSTSGGTNVYTALPPFDTDGSGSALTWNVGDPAQSGKTIYLDANGLPTGSAASARQIALVRITPPANAVTSGWAYVCIAWPCTAGVTWNGSQPTLKNQRGYVENIVYFTR